MKRIGLTGTIGSGKTTVGILLRRKGYPVFDSDAYSRILYQKTNPCYKEVVNAFGTEILDEFGEIDRKKLAAAIFGNEQLRLKLNGIVHPAVRAGMRAFFSHHEADRLVFAEVPLLFDAHMEDEFDHILVISCSSETAIARLMEYRSFTKQEAAARYATQMDIEQQKEAADTVIYNDGTLRELDEALDRFLLEMENSL